MEALFWTLSGLIGYVYAGYPLFLMVLRLVTGRKKVSIGSSRPVVTLVISAFNEEAVIREKLRNSIALDYPPERLEIIVVSDASSDRTDVIVEAFGDARVRLLRMPHRGGKTAGLNEAVAQARGDIIAFSDANAIYEHQAIRRLVRNFDDPAVGAAIGRSGYAATAGEADRNESAYWDSEVALKRLESELGSVVGGDGAIYAVRKDCYKPMSADALSDFVNPLQVVSQGYRCVYEPEALSVEEAAGSFDKEFRRKVRIVNRAWRATMSMKAMLNPLKYGLFSVQLISHKLLRWLVPLLLLALLAVNAALASSGRIYLVALVLQLAFYALALVGFLLARHRRLPVALSVPYYFCLVNLASLVGIAEVYLGKSYTTWSTPRTNRS